MGDQIVVDGMFVPDTKSAQLASTARSLRSVGGDISDTGNDITSSWSGLPGCYSAPEAEELYAVLDPVATDGEDVDSALESVASALETFAETVRELRTRALLLKADGFWNSLIGAESEKVAEKQRIIDEGAAIQQEFQEAERTCANAITALFGGTRFVGQDADGSTEIDAGEMAYGYTELPEDYVPEWAGGVAETDHGWWVDVGAAVGDFVVGAVEDLGAMVGAHSSEGWFQMSWGDAMAEQWENTAQSLLSLTGMYDAETDTVGWAGWDTVGSAWTDLAHSVVPWEEWDDRPGYVIGTAVLNIGVTALGAVLSATGVGAAVGVPLMAWRGASIVSGMGSRVPDVDLPDVDSPGVSVNLNLPNFAGGSRELLRIDLSRLDLGGLSPQRLADVKGALGRLLARFGGTGEGAEAPGGSPSTPRTVADGTETPETRNGRRTAGEDPTAQDLDDAMTVEDVLNPNSPEAVRLRDEYRGGFLENGVRSDGTPPSWEASENGRGDGPDMDREPALVGPRSDTSDASATPDAPLRRVDLTDNDLNDDLPNGRRDDADMRDRTPDVTNRVDNDAHSTNTPSNNSDGPDNTHPNDHENSVRTEIVDQGDGSGRITPAQLQGDNLTDINTANRTSGFLDNNGQQSDTENPRGGNNASHASGDNSGIRIPNDSKPEPVNSDNHPELRPRANKVFGDGIDLPPNRKFDVPGRGIFYTDSSGKVVFAEVSSGRKYAGWSAEMRNPRPDCTYLVDKRYTYTTDSQARTVSAEGVLDYTGSDDHRRHPYQNKIGNEGSAEYREINDVITDEREASQRAEIGIYDRNFRAENADWNGGHLIGAQFFGAGERLNVIPMLESLNQSKSESDNHANNYYKLESRWKDLIKGDSENGIPPAEVKVRISVDYASDMTTPHKIRIDYTINGQPQKPVRLANIPDMG